jgi:hypothetical protein
MRCALSWATNALLTPWNISAGDSSDYNFASGRLDYIIFYRVIDCIRQMIERTLLKRYFNLFVSVAELTRRWPTRLGRFSVTWYWPIREPLDQTKQAQADKINKEAGLLDEAELWQRKQMSWKEGIKQRLRIEQYERDQRELLGLPDPNEQMDQTTKAKKPVAEPDDGE